MDWPLHEPVSVWHDDSPSAGTTAGRDCLIECRLTIGLAVADGAVIVNAKLALQKTGRLYSSRDGRNTFPADFLGGTNRGLDGEHGGSNYRNRCEMPHHLFSPKINGQLA